MTELQTKQDASLFSEANFEHAFRIAKMISTTQLIPKAYHNKPADILVAFEFGRTLGLGQLQAVQNIAVINGRPCLWGDAVLGVCQGHHDFEYIKENPIKDGKGEVTGFECCVKRKSYPEETIRTFTVDDAKKAGLWGRNTWASYPQRMLQQRARGFALRDTFADALSGISVAEELEDYPKEKDITPKVKNNALADSLISLIEVNKPSPPPPPAPTVEPTVEQSPKKDSLNLDELTVIRDMIKEHNISDKKLGEALDKMGAFHIEHLSSDQADEFISLLLKDL